MNFQELCDLVKEYDSNIPKINRAYWDARQTWKELKPVLKTLREDPNAEVNPHYDLKYFIKRRDDARTLRKQNKKIKAKVEKIISAFNKANKKK